jgi:prophage antirepressor-like protein
MKTELWLGHEIRFVEITPNDWWAFASDIAEALAYSQVNNMLRMLKPHQKGLHLVNTLGGWQDISIISETGIYKLAFKSKRPEAEAFEEWVCSVLRELRRASGLEGFQVFRMLDKEHQKEAMYRLCGALRRPVRVDFIKCNCIADKAVSNLHGEAKMLHKRDMTPKMLTERQPILDEIVELMSLVDKYSLPVSVSEAIYGKHAKGEKKC